MFCLKSLHCRTTTQTLGGYNWKVEAVVHMPAKYWLDCKKKKQLGVLYGVDISNFIHRFHRAVPAWNPTVNDTLRSKKGIKTVLLTYYVSDPKQAESMGMKVTYLRNGEFIPGFGDIQFLM